MTEMSDTSDEPDAADDGDDWVEIERTAQHQVAYPAAVAIRLIGPSKRNSWCAAVLLRGAPLAWADEHGPRFKVMIGGRAANKVRLVPAKLTGRYEITVRKSRRTGVIGIGTIDCWPDEKRTATEAQVTYEDGVGGPAMVLILPGGWANALAPAKTEDTEPEPVRRPDPVQSFPVTTEARGLAAAAATMRKGLQ